jgi:hypothetical protein
MLFSVVIQSPEESTPGFFGNKTLHRRFNGISQASVTLVKILRGKSIQR